MEDDIDELVLIMTAMDCSGENSLLSPPFLGAQHNIKTLELAAAAYCDRWPLRDYGLLLFLIIFHWSNAASHNSSHIYLTHPRETDFFILSVLA